MMISAKAVPVAVWNSSSHSAMSMRISLGKRSAADGMAISI
jgi:hypothetical protein